MMTVNSSLFMICLFEYVIFLNIIPQSSVSFVAMLLLATLKPLELLLLTLINKYLITSNCITFLSNKPLSFITSKTFIYIIPDDVNLVEQLLKVSEMGCSDYVVHMREPQKFMTAFEKVNHLGNTRRSDRKIIILPYDGCDDISTASQIFSLKESSFVANLLMAVTSNVSDCISYDLYTHKFVGPDDEVNQPLYLDKWNSCTEEFVKGVNLFPHDMTNMYGKTLKVATFLYKPYILLDVDTAVEPLGRDGLEMRIVDEFCRWVNCTVEIIREDKNQWGEVYANESGGIGIIGSVLEDRADLGIGALYSWYEEYRVLDFSTPCVRAAVSCIAPSPRLLSSWKMPLMPFTWYMWFAVFVTFIYSSIGLIIAQGCSTDRILLTVFGMMIAQSQFNPGGTWKIRSVTGWLLTAGLLLASAYGAGLATTFTVPRYEPSIDTVEDILNRKLEWGATHDAWIFSLSMSNEPSVKQLVSQFRIYSFDELKAKSFTRSMAFSVEKLPAGTFAIGGYITREAVLNMTLMLEDFYYEQCVAMMRKSSPYTRKVSELVSRLHQSGLLLAWETQVALKHLDYKIQREVKLSRSKNDVGITKALNLGNVIGIFFLYATGVTMSFILIIGEILLHYYKNKHTI